MGAAEAAPLFSGDYSAGRDQHFNVQRYSAGRDQHFHVQPAAVIDVTTNRDISTERRQTNDPVGIAAAQNIALATVRELASHANDLEQACVKAWERVAGLATDMDTTLALEAWRRLTMIVPRNPRYWRERSKIALQAGSLDEAEKSAAKAEEIAF